MPLATGVPAADLAYAWPGLWPLIEPAYRMSPDKEDLIAGIRAQRFHLFGVYCKRTPVAGIVLRFLREGTSGELHCHVWLVGGSRLDEWAADFLAKLIPWAKAEGACAITGNGRIGWSRVMRRFGFERVEDRQGYPCWRLDI